jgi:hypothetical protein
MAAGKVLVLDANILIRAVLGIRARSLLLKYSMTAQFLVPDAAMKEAEEHLPAILSKRRIPMDASQAVLDSLTGIVQVAPSEAYSAFEEAAKRRLARRESMTGQFSRRQWPSVAPSGRKTQTSSEPELPHGRRTGSKSFCQAKPRKSNRHCD